jgi:hypothetical protein
MLVVVQIKTRFSDSLEFVLVNKDEIPILTVLNTETGKTKTGLYSNFLNQTVLGIYKCETGIYISKVAKEGLFLLDCIDDCVKVTKAFDDNKLAFSPAIHFRNKFYVDCKYINGKFYNCSFITNVVLGLLLDRKDKNDYNKLSKSLGFYIISYPDAEIWEITLNKEFPSKFSKFYILYHDDKKLSNWLCSLVRG